jgi:predicted transcriptional regulator
MMKEYNINRTTLKILGLYRNDYSRWMHVREIARETDVDVKAVDMQLRRLEKINILASVVKGRNKEYHMNLGNASTKYYMVLAETFATISFLSGNFIVKKIAGEILDRVDVPLILFGSHAKGRAIKESDVDLFALREKTTKRSLESAVAEASNLTGREINLKSATKGQFLKGLEAGDPLIREVVSEHIVLKGLDEFCGILWRYYAE